MHTATTPTPLTSDNQTMSDDSLRRCGNVLERLGYKIDSSDLSDIGELLASCLKGELWDMDLYPEAEPPPVEDWQSCERLQGGETPNMLYTAGFDDCMDEAIRYLVEEENLGEDDAVVVNLKSHLQDVKARLQSDNSDSDSDVPNQSENVTYDCYMSVNILDNCSPVFNIR